MPVQGRRDWEEEDFMEKRRSELILKKERKKKRNKRKTCGFNYCFIIYLCRSLSFCACFLSIFMLVSVFACCPVVSLFMAYIVCIWHTVINDGSTSIWRLCINMFKMCCCLGHDMMSHTAYDIFYSLTKEVFIWHNSSTTSGKVNKIAHLLSVIIGGSFLPSHLPFQHFSKAYSWSTNLFFKNFCGSCLYFCADSNMAFWFSLMIKCLYPVVWSLYFCSRSFCFCFVEVVHDVTDDFRIFLTSFIAAVNFLAHLILCKLLSLPAFFSGNFQLLYWLCSMFV